VTAIVPDGQLVYGLQLPVQAQSRYFVEPWEQTAGPAEIAAVARAADESDFFYVAVCDHVAIPRALAPTMSTVWYDPIATLSWVAAQTSAVRLLSSVYNLSYRHPLVAAKAFATLDALSDGRLIVGLGAGHVQAEFEVLGVDFHRRGSLLDAGIQLLDAALRDEFPLDLDVGLQPRPVQRPRPPLWIGGSSPAAVRRAARLADGWLPQGTPRAQLPPLLDIFRTERDDRPADIGAITEWLYVGTPSWDLARPCIAGSADELAALLFEWKALGVNHLQVRFPSRSVDELVDQVRAFGAEVGPLLAKGQP
jgi:probable F420-dependent oxidoreductase